MANSENLREARATPDPCFKILLTLRARRRSLTIPTTSVIPWIARTCRTPWRSQVLASKVRRRRNRRRAGKVRGSRVSIAIRLRGLRILTSTRTPATAESTTPKPPAAPMTTTSSASPVDPTPTSIWTTFNWPLTYLCSRSHSQSSRPKKKRKRLPPRKSIYRNWSKTRRRKWTHL